MAGEVTKEWRCFFCDELFINKEAAAEHFGDWMGCEADVPACKIKAEEGPLITYIRKLHQELQGYYQEDNELFSTIEKLQFQCTELERKGFQAAEQRGYDNGVRDMKAQGLCPEPQMHELSEKLERNAILRLYRWHKMQSTSNVNDLYSAASRLFGSTFNPAEYDEVE